MDGSTLVVILVVIGLVFGFAGAFISGAKKRSQFEGFLFGAMFGPLGLLIAVLMPQGDGTSDWTGQNAKPTPPPVANPNYQPKPRKLLGEVETHRRRDPSA
jgi:hypothetical protein